MDSYVRMESERLESICRAALRRADSMRAEHNRREIHRFICDSSKPRFLEGWRRPRPSISSEEASRRIKEMSVQYMSRPYAAWPRYMLKTRLDEYDSEKIAKRLLMLAESEHFVYVTASDLAAIVPAGNGGSDEHRRGPYSRGSNKTLDEPG